VDPFFYFFDNKEWVLLSFKNKYKYLEEEEKKARMKIIKIRRNLKNKDVKLIKASRQSRQPFMPHGNLQPR